MLGHEAHLILAASGQPAPLGTSLSFHLLQDPTHVRSLGCISPWSLTLFNDGQGLDL